MTELAAKIQERLVALLPDERFFPVEVKVSPSRLSTKVLVLIDLSLIHI